MNNIYLWIGIGLVVIFGVVLKWDVIIKFLRKTNIDNEIFAEFVNTSVRKHLTENLDKLTKKGLLDDLINYINDNIICLYFIVCSSRCKSSICTSRFNNMIINSWKMTFVISILIWDRHYNKAIKFLFSHNMLYFSTKRE